MTVVRDVPIKINVVNQLLEKILPLLDGQRKPDIEVALVAAYCCVADGVSEYPALTRQARANLVITRGTRALCDAIQDVGARSDTEVLALTASIGTCRN